MKKNNDKNSIIHPWIIIDIIIIRFIQLIIIMIESLNIIYIYIFESHINCFVFSHILIIFKHYSSSLFIY